MIPVFRRHFTAQNIAFGWMILVIAGFLIRAWHGLWFTVFVDEAEHVLGGQVINHGGRLYVNFVSQHGPVNFMLTQIYGAIFGWGESGGFGDRLFEHWAKLTGAMPVEKARFLAACWIPNFVRLISISLAAISTYCVATASNLPNRTARYQAAMLYLGLLTNVWLVQGLYLVNYHAIAGFFLAASLGLYLIPAWCGAILSPRRGFFAAFCLVMVAFTGYPYAPSAALFWFSAVWAARGQGQFRALFAGACAGTALMVSRLLLFGSLSGYVAFHLVENQRDFGAYMHFSFGEVIKVLLPNFAPDARVQTMAALAAFWGTGSLLGWTIKTRRWTQIGPILIGALALFLLCARASTYFHDGAFLVASLAWGSLMLVQFLSKAVSHRSPFAKGALATLCVIPIFAAEFYARTAVNTPFGMTRAQAVRAGYTNPR